MNPNAVADKRALEAENAVCEHAPRFASLEAVLLLGMGFVIRPFVDAIAAHDWFAAAAGGLYAVVAYRRIKPRLWSLSEHPARARSREL